MPYPESCPECGGVFRNTGTHFTARRNEVGRHVLLELGCQNTTRRFWWNFTTGKLNDETRQPAAPHAVTASTNGHTPAPPSNGHAVATLEPPRIEPPPIESEPPVETTHDELLETLPPLPALQSLTPISVDPANMRDAFVRQLQLDRLTLRQMRSWLMSDEARRAIEVAAGATEATYERLALILFGIDLPQLLGKQVAVPASTSMSAEERLELQREKARIRARLRRAAIKAAKLGEG